MKKLLIIAMAALLVSCSAKKNIHKTEIDTTVKDNSTVETVIVETITVENDTAVWTEIEIVEKIRPDTVMEISVEGETVAAKAVIKDGTITLTAISKPQAVKVPQTTTTERTTTVKETKDVKTASHTEEKVKVVEKGFKVPWWVWIIFAAAVCFIFYLKKVL